MLIDTHVHLQRHEFGGDQPAVLARAVAAGVTRFVNVGYDLPSSLQSLALAQSDERIFATVGVHPHDASRLADATGRLTAEGEGNLAKLEELAARPRVVAVGEIGLDFYRDLSPRPAQQAAFVAQLALAERVGLPVVFHVRDAYAETRAVLETVGVPGRGGVLHAFAGDADLARWACEHGLRLGIGGPVTYRKSHLPELLAERTPDDLLLETDAPWLPPVPHRGQRNEPSYLRLVAEKVADLYGLELDELAQLTSRTCEALFPRLAAPRRA